MANVREIETERFWDERAKENAIYFVDNEVEYDDPDTEEFWRRGDVVLERMLDLVEFSPHPDDSVLDIGCGVGRTTRALASRVKHVVGIDVSAEMLKLASEYNANLSNVDWVHGDGRRLSAIEDDSVDGCFSHVVFQHISDPAVTLSYVLEMGRVLRPGGWALFQVSTDPKVHRPQSRLRERIRRTLTPRSSETPDRHWWGSAVEVAELRSAIDQAELRLRKLLGEGSQFTTVLATRDAEPGD